MGEDGAVGGVWGFRVEGFRGLGFRVLGFRALGCRVDDGGLGAFGL